MQCNPSLSLFFVDFRVASGTIHVWQTLLICSTRPMIFSFPDTIPAFSIACSEYVRRVGRYSMAIKEDNIQDREFWTGVARHRYSQASDKAYPIGRLYHHFAIVARAVAIH